MTFDQALFEMMNKDAHARRDAWVLDTYVRVEIVTIDRTLVRAFVSTRPNGTLTVWNPSQDDMLADDWGASLPEILPGRSGGSDG